MSLAGIGLATGASLPWVLKFLWAPLVDRLGSRRTLDPRPAWAARGHDRGARRRRPRAARARCSARCFSLYVTLSATQDIAIDAYTIETTHGPRAGRGQLGADRGVPRARASSASALLVWVAARHGWRRRVPRRRGHRRARSPPRSFFLARAGARAQHAESLAEPIRALLRRPGHLGGRSSSRCSFKLDISAMDPMTKPFWVDRAASRWIRSRRSPRAACSRRWRARRSAACSRRGSGIFRALWTLGLVQLLSSLGYAAAASRRAPASADLGRGAVRELRRGTGDGGVSRVPDVGVRAAVRGDAVRAAHRASTR